MRRFLLVSSLFLLGCPIDTGGGGSGGGGGGTTGGARVSGRLTVFQGAGSAPVKPTLASLLPKRMSKENPELAVGQLFSTNSDAPPKASPTPEWIPGEIIVRLEEKLTAKQALTHLRIPDWSAAHAGFASEYLHMVRLTKGDGARPSIGETHELAAQLKKIQGVRFTEVNQRQRAFAVPNDKLYSAQWHYPAINLPATWDITQGSATVVVADLDTGIVPHPDLDARLIPGIDMISDPANGGDGDGRDNDPLDMGGDQPQGASSWHGSHTAGTIGAATNNMVGISGVDWNSKLLVVRVLGKQGGDLLDIAAGMNWATGGTVPGTRANTTPAKVVNMSLGGTSSMGASQAYQDIIDAANNVGAIFVIAAGNSNEDASKTIPCIQQNVICVGATRFSGKRASYSNFGAAITVMAPGGEMSEDANGDGYPDGVLSTVRDKQNQPALEFSQGTSMATPHVCGVVALMKAVNPALTFAAAKMHLTSTATKSSQCNEGCGAGMVNAQAAVLAAKGTPPTGPAKLSVNATDLFFSQGAASVSLGISNVGAMPLNVMATVSGTAASSITFPKGATATVAGGQTGSIDVTAAFTGLANGTHPATIVVNSNGGEATVNVKIRVGGGSGKDAEVGLAYQALDGTWKVAAVALATAANGYTYSIDAPPGKYFVLAAMDENGNSMLDDAEPIGLYPTKDSPEEITVVAGAMLNNIDFQLVPNKPIKDDQAAGIGGACTTTCPDNATCLTTGWPGGYCSKACDTAACPLGSSCIGTTTLFCASQCAAPGAGQSTCRTSYVCYDEGTGNGICLPRCTGDPDCGGLTCNLTTGYCQ